ncbi:MAG: alpha/beta hydrolase [Haliea sp.]
MLQSLKVWLLRHYYRWSGARAWRGNFTDAPYSTLQLPLPGRSLAARLYSGPAGRDLPLVIYFHGGGWVIGDLESHHAFCQQLREQGGCTVVALDYRLAPEHPCPAALDDCREATRWLVQNLESSGPNNGSIVLAGDSAGGHLAVCTALTLDPEARARLVGALLIYPVVDHYSTPYASYVERAQGQTLTSSLMRWFWDTWLAGEGAQAATAAGAVPMHSKGLATLPPCLLVTAERDPLRDEGVQFAAQLRAAGITVSSEHYGNAEHGFACSQGPTPDCKHFMTLARGWLRTL